jgi:hypothetical protein
MAILEFIVLMLLGGHPWATGDCLERSVNAVIVVWKARVLFIMIDPGSGHLIFFIPLQEGDEKRDVSYNIMIGKSIFDMPHLSPCDYLHTLLSTPIRWWL